MIHSNVATSPNNKPNQMPSDPSTATPYTIVGPESARTGYNILASILHWISLAGLILFPGTFAYFDRISMLRRTEAGRALRRVARNIPILYVAGCACILGGLGVVWLWWTVRHNSIWLISRVFFPSILGGLIRLVTTLVNVYTTGNGD
ncbi:hypothetical protein F4813DRAFT_160591 [Daldinia decipiens]|uniref:uncharacterized protein n=1 Tax=Daldinia decipiens TaxID=326647 RepID=UPI0020C57788|nr:uncharacterized protein F4813DRAFT_160591 [Daldinia decipiens]KAI1655481.1 hypothetical protein F4813DRAFT_160591 [Daldinia decipiens]